MAIISTIVEILTDYDYDRDVSITHYICNTVTLRAIHVYIYIGHDI